MSLKTWISEFYPKEPSQRMTKRQAVEHSIQKWTGLLPQNLRKHSLFADWEFGSHIYYKNEDSFDITWESCALCIKYEDGGHLLCEKCPLFKSLKNKRCDDPGEPYVIWRETGNPRPMIKALKKVLKKLDEEK
jgi:hypothetical protein